MALHGSTQKRHPASACLLGCLLTLALGLLFAAAAGATTFTVSCGEVTGPDGLDAAITAADAARGRSTIDLQGCIYTIAAAAAPSDPAGPDGLPMITGALTIDGDGATILRSDSAPHFRIMDVTSGASVVLNGLTISGGYSDNSFFGGGILNVGRLSLDSSDVLGNVGEAGGAGIGSQIGASLRITDSVISDNSAPGPNDGGGIVSGGALVIQDSEFSDNSAGVAGGAIQGYGTLRVTGSQFQDNSADFGGAILDQTTATIISSTLDGNVASGENGGALYIEGKASASLSGDSLTDNSAADAGGAIYLEPGGLLTLILSGIRTNVAGFGGGGIYASQAAVISALNVIAGNEPDNCEPMSRVLGCSG